MERFEMFKNDAAVALMRPRVNLELYKLLRDSSETVIAEEDVLPMLDKVTVDIEDFDNSEMGFVHSSQVIAMIQVIGSSIKRGLNSTIVVICDETYNKNCMMSKILDLNGFDCVYYTINSNNKYECKIALGKRRMNRCRNCYFATTNFSMCYL